MSIKNDVIVLKEGYSFTNEKGEQRADGTISLIRGATNNIVVDTGGPQDARILIQELEKHGLCASDVDTVVGTHGHSDHIGNLNLFPHAFFIVGTDASRGDHYIEHNMTKGEPLKLCDGIEVISTPGHTGNDVSVIVQNTSLGTVAVAGDLFEREGDLSDDNVWRENSENPEVQSVNRDRVLQIADYIVPGHGPIFKVPQKYKTGTT